MPHVVPSSVVGFIDDIFPNVETQELVLNQSSAGHFAMIVGLSERIPEHLLTLEAPDYTGLIASLEDLRSAIQMQVAQGPRSALYSGRMASLKAFGNCNAVAVVRRVLKKCPDQAPRPSTATLMFVKDIDLRDSLRLDFESVASAIDRGDWKAATVLSGSAMEALLLWAIELAAEPQRRAALDSLLQSKALAKRPDNDPQAWDLSAYIAVAHQLGEISSDTERQAQQVRMFRNLIHPGRAQRTGRPCSGGTAHAAWGGLLMVADDLERKHS